MTFEILGFFTTMTSTSLTAFGSTGGFLGVVDEGLFEG